MRRQERAAQKAYWVWKRAHGHERGVSVRGGERVEKRSGVKWEGVRLGGRERKLNCRALANRRQGRSCARGEVSWTAFVVQLYSVSRSTSVNAVVQFTRCPRG